MAAINLNTVRATIEKRLDEEFRTGQAVPIVFNNVPFDASTTDLYIQCVTSFGESQYLTQGTNTTATNNVVGLTIFNIYSKQGVGAGSNFDICKRLRDLYNRITISSVIFDAPIGPEILQSSPEGKFQTQIRITFTIYEDL
tara:strand:+ start:844 stop:1266 length:423 start_codon:yes stop_codon:yes gene_type:complete